MATEAEILAARRTRAEKLTERGVNLFPARVPRDLENVPELVERYAEASAEELESEELKFCVAGRIVGLRSFGKAAFVTVQADGERIQIWMKRDLVGEQRYDEFKLYEVGDFMWGRGRLIRTKTGALTIEAVEFGFLAKSYRPLPEKFHGLQDVEARYRQRYLDLIANPDSRNLALVRARAVSVLRQLLDERGFLEVETPILQPIYGGAHARPFTTRHNIYDQELYLRISFELYLKRLIIGGIDRVYEIGRDFRNEGISKKHNPEFSMLEVYQAYADYGDMMDLLESLVSQLAERVLGTTRLERNGVEIDLAPPWPRLPMAQLIREASGIDIEQATDLESLRAAVKQSSVGGVEPDKSKSWGALVDEIFSETVEPGLQSPTFVIDYPVELSPLAKGSEDSTQTVERFEAFAGGMELANAFSELNDPDVQRVRFEAQQLARAQGDQDAQPFDDDFLLAMEHGMPPTGGMGLGIGRLVLILTGAAHLREVKLFPHLRPRND